LLFSCNSGILTFVWCTKYEHLPYVWFLQYRKHIMEMLLVHSVIVHDGNTTVELHEAGWTKDIHSYWYWTQKSGNTFKKYICYCLWAELVWFRSAMLYKCYFCNHITEGEHFENHLRWHTKELPYKCHFKCKSYNIKSSLWKHYKTRHPKFKFCLDEPKIVYLSNLWIINSIQIQIQIQ